MVPLLLAALGAVALIAAAAILRSFGSRFRVGRILAAAPQVSIADAVALADSGAARYVRIAGRIDSEDEFEDADHQPLVFRRTTLAWRPPSGRGGWTTFESSLEAVPFVLREGLDEVGIDPSGLAEGLVVVPRESHGRIEDLGDRPPADLARDAEANVRIEQVSSVEHAIAAGVPTRGRDGRVRLAAGLGRPLILTTLEIPEAMRILTGGARRRSQVAVACLGLAGVLLAAALVWWVAGWLVGDVATVLAASPDPSQRPGSDTRSSGQGPGLVGDPLLAVLAMLAIAALSVLASLAYVRLTASRSERLR